MPRKENTKARTWERDRRERMNTYFKTLGDLLPPHQDGRKRNKVDILIHAAKYIKDLQGRADDLFHAHASDVHKEELVRLKKLVSQLYSRTQLLSTLLKEAGISIPAEPAIEKVSAFKWSNKINLEDSEKLFMKIEEKKRAKRKKEKVARKKVPSKRKPATPSQPQSKRLSNSGLKNADRIEDQENRVNSINKDKKLANDTDDLGITTGTQGANSPSTISSTPAEETKAATSTGCDANFVAKKVDSFKKVKRKTKINQKNKIINHRTNHQVKNITSGTLILSGGKIMPVVTPITPLTSNIIVNPQAQSTNPFILSNGQSNQMIVMQHLPNPGQNSVIPVCNQTLINAVQKVTLNPVSKIHTNIVVSSQDWVANVKSIINATKISGRKCILPKGREITKTTMTYKVPIPAVHKEKIEKSKEILSRKDAEVKNKPKNSAKGIKNHNNSAKLGTVDETSKNNKEDALISDNKESSSLKRVSSTECVSLDEPDNKKIKTSESVVDLVQEENILINNTQITNPTSTCKSIESLRHVIQKIGSDLNETTPRSTASTCEIEVKKFSDPTNEERRSPAIDKHNSGTQLATEEQTVEDSTTELLQCPNSSTVDVSEKEEPSSIKSIESTHCMDLRDAHIQDKELTQLNGLSATRYSSQIATSTVTSVTVIDKPEESLKKISETQPIDNEAISATSNGGNSTEVREEEAVPESVKAVCNLGTRFDSLLQANDKRPELVENVATLETSKIILNLDTNTTTTLKPEANAMAKSINSTLLNEEDNLRANKLANLAKDEGLKSLLYSADNSFIPISRSEALHSDLSNDIFASLQVPSSSHHPESISPTAAFLMAFPLVSSLNGKTEVLEEEMKEDFKYRSQTPPMLLQIGAMEPNSFKLKASGATSSKEHIPDEEKKNLSSNLASYPVVSMQKYVKAMPEINKDLEASSKLINDESEVKGNQNLLNSGRQEKTTNSQSLNDTQQIAAESTKSLPKIIHTENLKEQYKIVQTSIPSSLTTAIEVNNTFVYTSTTSSVSYSTTPVITTCARAQIQSAPTVHHNRPVPKNTQNAVVPILASTNPISDSTTSLAAGINSNFQTSISTAVQKYDLRSQYTSTQNFIPNYPNISGNMELPQYTPPTFTSSVEKSSQSSLNNHVPNISSLTQVSQVSTQCHGQAKTSTSIQNLINNYPVRSKESHSLGNTDQHSGVNETLRLKQHSQDHRLDGYHRKKVETENFGQSFSFNKEDMINSQNQSVQGNTNPSMFQDKHTSTQSYIPYSKNAKKISASMITTAVSTGKSVLENTVHYSQNPMIAASNYDHSTVTDSSIKSTTTVAHNSSNFSILSWTTFSPVGGNNNAMHYEQGQPPSDSTENKTVCENFGYIPLHKDNVGFSNMLPEFPNEGGMNVNKLGNKPMLETHKQSFIDQTKPQSIQTTITPLKQNQNPSSDYKFNNENKNKAKYTIENNFMQTNYPNMEQQAKHQTISNKQDKSNYPMPSYNPQVLFNMPDAVSQVKYSTENYTGANFKYTEKLPQNQKYHPTAHSHVSVLEQPNSVYKQTQNGNKSKIQQIRPPVNWMMTPEIKHNTNIPDIILPPIGKELEYCQNNLFTQNTSYNQGSTNQFYNNYDATHSFSNISVIQNEPKKVDTFYSEEQPFSWSPTKNTHVVEQTQSIKPIDQHIVPSTLPTLVGDLALGTNIPEKQSFIFGQMSTRLSSEHNKEMIKEKDSNVSREFHTILHSQNGQHAVQGTFLSVSQLVEHEKAEKSQQARKHQRKSTSPRGSGKNQLDIRKQTAADQLHHDDQKSNVQNFPEQNYQQKYQQNDTHWRNRNCKSNYTAEALIGTNTNVQDDNQQDKHASIKFTSNYAQNKFPGTLSTETMMPINYFPNTDDGNNYGQANQNFNSYSYSSNANIYPTTNFITSISNTPTNYMMPLHENSDYLETNSFLLPNASSANPIKSQHYTGKHQNCDKRPYSTPKRSKRKPDMTQNIEFPISGINSPLEDYHSSFLSHANLYQNPSQANIYPKAVNTNLPGLPMTGNQNTVGPTGLPMNSNIPRGTSSGSPMVMTHPSGTSLTNFNLSTIFPEINDKVVGYKPPNSMPPGLTHSVSHTSNYAQRANYSNSLGHTPQVSESNQFANNMPPSSSVHYKNS
ncbi:uncharacterized protein LOC105683643 isoform X1 [Athalia rosae]|uniref:uncharacterized protein LOC105683643 isoform X1 n=2 Tax=Athalia rosae TaxID=37344 RepID=UPI0020339F1C|nr:uncharacterized protein LOC105683643 isoform X1 [Athalia rosae]